MKSNEDNPKSSKNEISDELDIGEYINKYTPRKNFWGMRRLYFTRWSCLLGCGYDFVENVRGWIKAKLKLLDNADTSMKMKPYDYLWHRLSSAQDRSLYKAIVAHRVLDRSGLHFQQNVDRWSAIYKKLSLRHRKIERENRNGRAFITFSDVLSGSLSTQLDVDMAALGSIVCGQYQHPLVQPEKGDYCFDFGAFMGETSLLFADLVGEEGKVYAFEFGENAKAFQHNASYNPQFTRRLELVPFPSWSESNRKVYVSGRGSSCRISFEPLFTTGEKEYKTITLDDVMSQYGIRRCDYIKMDVEGAELPILRGAIQTISRFKPKLAISIYHASEDFERIPKFIDELNLGYRFHIGHYSPKWTETVLYAYAK